MTGFRSNSAARFDPLQSPPAAWPEPAGAQAVIFGLLVSTGETPELSALSNLVDEQTLRDAKEVAALVESWHSVHAIAMIDLAIPALRRLTPEEYQRFTGILEAIITSDRQIDLFEFMLQRLLRRHLDRWFHQSPPGRMQYRTFQQLIPQLEILLTAMSGVGARTPDQAAAALAAGQSILAEHGVYLKLQARPGSLEEISAALEQFDAATPLIKKQLLIACVAVAKGDGDIASEEAEMLRAVADTIGCPMPPLLTV